MKLDTDVLIAGAGPVGLVLAHELAHRGVSVQLVERNQHSTRHPKMDITNARSMEHFRRLGLAEQVRRHATPPEHGMAVLWTERLGGDLLARFDYPSYHEMVARQAYITNGTGVAEPAMRISQVLLEPVLRELLEARGEQVSVDFGWRLDRFEESSFGVKSWVTQVKTGAQKVIYSRYLVGCDGASSTVRKQLGIEWDVMDSRTGPLKAIQNRYGIPAATSTLAHTMLKRASHLPDGRVYLIHFKAKDLNFFHRHGVFWHEQCAKTGDTLIAQDDMETWTLHVVMDLSMDTSQLDPHRFLCQRLGRDIDCEILAANEWRPALTIAKKMGQGRVWLAGDACHQVIPTGGYGMNTGVGEAVTLGWMLAARVQGWGGRLLLTAYEAERRPIIENNRYAAALNAGVRLMITAHATHNHRQTANYIRRIGNLENEALGLEVDYRYAHSPIIFQERGPQPKWQVNTINPSTHPGCRLPHVWLAPNVSVFDRLGDGFTLIVTNPQVDSSAFTQAAAELKIPFSTLIITHPVVQRLYETALVLVRPDQHVAWRGDTVPPQPLAIFKRVTGHG